MTIKKSNLGGIYIQAHLRGYKNVLKWGVNYINKLLGWTQNFQNIMRKEFHIKICRKSMQTVTTQTSNYSVNRMRIYQNNV